MLCPIRTVIGGRGEHFRGDIRTNGIESFWAMLKRSNYGCYHYIELEAPEEVSVGILRRAHRSGTRAPRSDSGYCPLVGGKVIEVL